MKRIDIMYGENAYSVGGRDLAELQAEIMRGFAGGGEWLRVNHGEGQRHDAFLLIGPGTPIALIPIPEDPTSTEEPSPADGPGAVTI
jgi:hypothetical protein